MARRTYYESQTHYLTNQWVKGRLHMLPRAFPSVDYTKTSRQGLSYQVTVQHSHSQPRDSDEDNETCQRPLIYFQLVVVSKRWGGLGFMVDC